jgi:hypothetical protein
MGMPTILDVLKHNKKDAIVGLVEEAAAAHPEITFFPSRPVTGIKYETLVRTKIGNMKGSFRKANSGTTPIVHTYENREVSTYILNPRIECDKAVADRSIDGASAYIATQTGGVMEGEMQGLASQFYYGAANNADGFPGLINLVDPTMVVDAGGSTADTGSSVWVVVRGFKNVAWAWGQNGLFEMSDPRVESILDPNDQTKKLDGYVSSLTAYPGLQVASIYSIARIKNLTAQDGKGLTDDLLADVMALFPTGMIVPENVGIFMNRRSRKQLQKSRKTSLKTSAPTPTDYEGIQIYPTDAITSTEAIA